MNRIRLIGLTIVLCLSAGACDTDDPAVAPSPSASPSASPGQEATPTSNPLILAEGSTGNGINYQFRVVPLTGGPVCVQLRRVDEFGDFMVCDEKSAQDFNGSEGFRYGFGALNPEQVPKFVIGITDDEVARVRVDLADIEGPEVPTVASSAAPDHRFFVVMLDPDPARHVLAVRGLDSAGKTVAGFSLGEGQPSPLPTGV